MQTGTYGTDVPVYLDYRMGGASTIRGYDIEDLGRRILGKNQAIGTAEYSWNLVALRRIDLGFLSLRLGLDFTLFGDVGVAWSEPGELSMKRTRGGLGAGIRLLVPGSEMTRLDVGWSPEGGFQFHFGSWSKPHGLAPAPSLRGITGARPPAATNTTTGRNPPTSRCSLWPAHLEIRLAPPSGSLHSPTCRTAYRQALDAFKKAAGACLEGLRAGRAGEGSCRVFGCDRGCGR